MRILPSFAVPCLLVVSSLLATSPTSSAQLRDYTVGEINIVQILESNSFARIGDRSTILRVGIDVANATGPDPLIDGIVRMYVNGAEHPDSPIMSTNGPFAADGNYSPAATVSWLNFACIPPVSNNVVFEVEVNPAGPNWVPESNSANNFLSTAPQNFIARGTMDLAYAPIDYRPGGGGSANLPNLNLIKPAVGDNFVQGIFPGSRIEYRRIDSPSKLWTGNLNGTGSSLNSSLNSDLFQMVPRPDFIYGWVPGGLPYNGQAFLNGKASMGNTQDIRHQRTYAHELGHNFGRQHNNTQLSEIGFDVEHHLWQTQNLGKVKKTDKFDIMAAGLLTTQAWVASISLSPFYNHPVFNTSSLLAGDVEPGPQLLVSGVWNRETGAIELDPIVELPNTEPAEAAEFGLRDLVLRGYAGERVVSEMPITVRSGGDDGACAGDTDSLREPETLMPFVTLVPARGAFGEAVDSLEVAAAGSSPVITERRFVSPSEPLVSVISPAPGQAVGSFVDLQWQAIDEDGDALTTTVRYAPDGGERRVPIATRLSGDSLSVDLSELPAFRAGKGFFELLVSDGFHTTVVQTSPLEGSGAFAGAGGNAPFVEIYHPDDGRSFARGSKLFLHSSGWDLEDLALDGSSIQWMSDVDGPLGSGRRFSIDTLSVGAHQITVTATDSGGQQTMRTHAITINDRDLPFAYDLVCQEDLGFAGPGSATLSFCGNDLTEGGSADLRLEGAAANAPVFMFLGLANNPTPTKGGVVVPVPWTAILNLATDGNGEIFLPGIVGSGGPLTFYLQAVIADGSQVLGYDFSNALQVEF